MPHERSLRKIFSGIGDAVAEGLSERLCRSTIGGYTTPYIRAGEFWFSGVKTWNAIATARWGPRVARKDSEKTYQLGELAKSM